MSYWLADLLLNLAPKLALAWTSAVIGRTFGVYALICLDSKFLALLKLRILGATTQ
jgi:hypothetical protein